MGSLRTLHSRRILHASGAIGVNLAPGNMAGIGVNLETWQFPPGEPQTRHLRSGLYRLGNNVPQQLQKTFEECAKIVFRFKPKSSFLTRQFSAIK